MFLRVGLHVIETQTILIAINFVVIETSFSYHKVLIVVNKIVIANLVVTEKVFNCYPMITPFRKMFKSFYQQTFGDQKIVISNFVMIEKGFSCHPMCWPNCWMVTKTHFSHHT